MPIGLDPEYDTRVRALMAAALEAGQKPQITSAFRSPTDQARAIDSASRNVQGRPASIVDFSRGIKGYAAPVGGSQHEKGLATDWADNGSLSWVRENAPRFGVRFPESLARTDPIHSELDSKFYGPVQDPNDRVAASGDAEAQAGGFYGQPQPASARMALGGPQPAGAAPAMHDGLTPADVEQRRRMAASLMQQGTDASPVGHWTQALARVLQGGMGGYYGRSASDAEKQGTASRGAFMTQAMSDPAAAVASGIANPWTTDMAGNIAGKVIGQKLEQSSPGYQMDLKLKQGQLTGQGLTQQVTQAQLEQFKLQTPHWRMENAEKFGFVKGTPEYRQFIVTGTVSTKDNESTLDKEVAKARVGLAESDIKQAVGAQGMGTILDQLDKLGKDPALDSAIGPMQGSVIGQTIGGMVPFAKSFGLANPKLNADIRRLQAQLEIAGGEKMKGLGAQSDADAARLAGAVSNLTAARDPQEFKDALAIIRNSIAGAIQRGQLAAKEFPSLGGGRVQMPTPAPNAAPQAQGARQAPDGNWYVPDPNRPGKYLMVQP